MRFLLSLPRDQVQEVAEEEEPRKGVGAGERRKNVRSPLYSMKALDERPDM